MAGQTFVSVNAIEDNSGLVMAEVMVENVPENLLGASFYLKVKGMAWGYKGFKEGELFTAGDPIWLVKEKGNELIFGVTLKRSDFVGDGGGGAKVGSGGGDKEGIVGGVIGNAENSGVKSEKGSGGSGKLASFIFEPASNGNMNIEFERPVLSVYENGRKDLRDVVWSGTSIEVENVEEVSGAGDLIEKSSHGDSVLDFTEGMINVAGPYSRSEMRYAGAMGDGAYGGELLDFNMYFFIGLILGLAVLVSYLFFVKKVGRRRAL